jgi:hypothetical protein
VSSGSALVAQRATQALKSASQGLLAQFILVSQDEDPAFVSTVERTGAEFVVAPSGSTRAEMCDLGMSRASGSIVAVRDDVAVGDARWLDTYRAVLPMRDATAPLSPVESVVLDTLVAGRAGLADRAPSFATLESKARAATIEMAAAVAASDMSIEQRRRLMSPRSALASPRTRCRFRSRSSEGQVHSALPVAGDGATNGPEGGG